MYEHKIIKSEDKAIGILQKDGWGLCAIVDGKMYFKKAIKITHNITIDKESPEWIEFITLYRTINTKGSYTKTLIKKYHESIKKFPHKDMIEKLDQYKKHLESFTLKPPLQVSTFLNQERYRDDYEVTKVDFTNKWKDDMLKEQKVPKAEIDAIMTEDNAWVNTHGKTREMTSGVFQAIIDKYYTK